MSGEYIRSDDEYEPGIFRGTIESEGGARCNHGVRRGVNNCEKHEEADHSEFYFVYYFTIPLVFCMVSYTVGCKGNRDQSKLHTE